MSAANRADLLRPSDVDTLRAELRSLKQVTDLPILFGGTVDGADLVLSGYVGTRGRFLRNLVISSERGLGGRAIAEQRPGSVADYFTSPRITHDYDRPVAGEGIESLLAVPVVVRGKTRAAMYGGLRTPRSIGDAVTDRIVQSARALAREIEIRDEVDRRVALPGNIGEGVEPEHGDRIPRTVSDTITETYLELREIAALTNDSDLESRLRGIEGRLRALGSAGEPVTAVRLTPRERDVLGYVALGCRNAEIAERLSLSPETVKSYVRNILAKLEVHGRHEAVVEARRRGLLL